MNSKFLQFIPCLYLSISLLICLFFFCVLIHECVCVYVCVSVRAHVYRRQRSIIFSCHSSGTIYLVLEKGSLTRTQESLTRLSCLLGKSRYLAVITFLKPELKSTPQCLAFYLGLRDQIQQLRFMWQALLAELFPHTTIFS